jgi:hypothetical protein
LLLGLSASLAGAQVHNAADRPARLIEAELLAGYTPVELERWANTRPTSSDQTSYGVKVRAYLIFIGKTRVGLELGNQHFFTWEQSTQVGSTIVRRINTVAGFNVGVVTRPCDTPRFDCDAGYGFYFLGDVVPGAHFGMNYVLLKRRRMSIPIGARIDLLFGDQAFALPLALKTGVTF